MPATIARFSVNRHSTCSLGFVFPDAFTVLIKLVPLFTFCTNVIRTCFTFVFSFFTLWFAYISTGVKTCVARPDTRLSL